MRSDFNSGDNIRWVPIINTEAVAIPPRAMMEVKSGSTRKNVRVGYPSQNSQTTAVIVNGPGVIPVGGVGQGAYPGSEGQLKAAYEVADSSLDPVGGDNWGTVKGSWYLDEFQSGFQIVNDGANGICNIIPAPVQSGAACCCDPNAVPGGAGGGGTGGTGGGSSPPIIVTGGGGPLPGGGTTGSGGGIGGGPTMGNTGCGANEHQVVTNDGVIRCAPGAPGTIPGGEGNRGIVFPSSISPFSPSLAGNFMGQEGQGLSGARFVPRPEGGTGLQTTGADGNVLTALSGEWVSAAPAGGSPVTSTVTTTDNTATTIATIALTSNNATVIDITVVGVNTGATGGTHGDTTWYSTRLGFSCIAGTASTVGTSVAINSGATIIGSLAAVSTSGGNVLVKVTGPAVASTYNWKCTYTIIDQIA